MGRVWVWSLVAVFGCGRLDFEPVVVTAAPADGALADGIMFDVGGGTTCSGPTAATCPVTARPIGPGVNVHESGTTLGLADGRAGSCGGGGVGEFILELDISQFGFYNISTAGSDFDTVIYVFDGDCTTAEFDCKNAVVGSGGEALTLGVGHAGPFMIVLDGVGGCGHFELDIQG